MDVETGDDPIDTSGPSVSSLVRLTARRGWPAGVIVADAVRVAAAYVVVLVLRFDGSVPAAHWDHFLRFLPVAVMTHLLLYWAWHLYAPIWRHASIREARRVLEASVVSAAALLLFDILVQPRVPVSVVLLGSVMAMLLTGASRFQARLVASARADRTPTHAAGQRVALLGAGEAGAAMVRALAQRTGELLPVVALDDNRRLHGLTLLGIPVVASIEELPDVAKRFNVSLALLCVPDASPQLMRRVASAAEAAGVQVKVVPSVEQLVSGAGPIAASVRDLRIEDLLGRSQIETDLGAVAAMLKGRRVLITGAGGSIGSEIARQVNAFEPSELLLLDHDETHVHDIGADLPSAVQILADIRDAELLEEIFRRYKPEVVFHAAAHKHVPILELYPQEAVRTNVFGTQNVLDAAVAVGVERFVNISTDKAVDPSNVMGASKWVGEQLVMRTASEHEGAFCAVRFGNVIGSRGSVIATFAKQIERGGPVTVTDPRMSRFFMSVQEAVQLVLQAGALVTGGELYMLEMGEPVNILELAKRMIRLSGYEVGSEIEVRITGRRPGEKLFERLTADGEETEPTAHPSIRLVHAVPLAKAQLDMGLTALHAVAEATDSTAGADTLLALAQSITSSRPSTDPEGAPWSSTTT